METRSFLRLAACFVFPLALVSCYSKGDTAAAAEVTPMTTNADLKQRLTPLQYYVTQQSGTEPPFANEYWNNHRPGLYVDVVSGAPLFSSKDKYDSGTGWPSFTKPIDPSAVVTRVDSSEGMVRTEVRGAESGSHLGHVFNDGPPPTGLRYCLNSAALRFVPKEDLESQGYSEFLNIF